MKRQLELRPGVAAELAEAIAHYDTERPGLGERFLAAVEATLADVVAAPDLGSSWTHDPSVRRQVVRRFPYVIFYRADAEAVTVLAIAHGKRRPGYWRARLR